MVLSGRFARDSYSLASLLAPITIETFIKQYWGQKPLYLQGDNQKFDLFKDITFKHLLSKTNGQEIFASLPDYEHRAAQRHGVRPVLLIYPGQADAMLAAGATLALMNAHKKDENIFRLVTAVKTELCYVGDITSWVWLSPTNNGVPFHFDEQSNFTLQLAGKKRWRISPYPVLDWPARAGQRLPDGTATYDLVAKFGGNTNGASAASYWEYDIKPIDDREFIEVTLEPGDLLFIPAGSWHTTEAICDEATESSLALNIHMYPTGFGNLLLQVIKNSFEEKPAWRHIPPTAKLPEDGSLPADIEQFFATRIEELCEWLKSLKPGMLQFNRVWKKMLVEQADQEVINKNLALSGDVDHHLPLEPEDKLRFSRHLPITYAAGVDADGCEQLNIYLGNKEVEFNDPDLIALAKRLIQEKAFSAASAMEWAGNGQSYDWEQVREVLEALLEEGFLERSD